MKTVKYALCMLFGLMIFSCTNNADDLRPGNVDQKASEKPLSRLSEESGEELYEIGFFEGEEFHFTVSDEKLWDVYAYNVEQNLDGSGNLESATVIQSTEESDENGYFIVLEGSFNGEGSASLSAGVITQYDEALGSIRCFISARPVFAGICFNYDCSRCRQSDLTVTNKICRCNTNFNLQCPYVEDPTFVWIW